MLQTIETLHDYIGGYIWSSFYETLYLNHCHESGIQDGNITTRQ